MWRRTGYTQRCCSQNRVYSPACCAGAPAVCLLAHLSRDGTTACCGAQVFGIKGETLEATRRLVTLARLSARGPGGVILHHYREGEERLCAAVILITAASASRVPHSGGSCRPFARRHSPLTCACSRTVIEFATRLWQLSFTSCLLHFLAVGTPSHLVTIAHQFLSRLSGLWHYCTLIRCGFK